MLETKFVLKLAFIVFIVVAVVSGSLLAIRTVLEPPGVFKTELTMQGEPVLGRPVKLTYTLNYSPHCPGISEKPSDRNLYKDSYCKAYINLPEEFELIEGELEWNGYLHCGEAPRKMEAIVKPLDVGEYRISTEASSQPSIPFPNELASPSLYVNTFSDRGIVSDKSLNLGADTNKRYVSTGGAILERQVSVDLALSSKPSFSQETKLVCTLKSKVDTPMARLTVSIPSQIIVKQESIQVTRGNLKNHLSSKEPSVTWDVDMVKGDIVKLTAIISLTNTGSYNIHADAYYQDIPPRFKMVDRDTLKFNVFHENVDVIHPIYMIWPSIRSLTASAPDIVRVGNTVDIQCTVMAVYNTIEKARLRLMPDDRYYVIISDFTWNGDLQPDTPINATARIKPITAGNFSVTVMAENYRPLPKRYMRIAHTQVEVNSTKANLSK
jgi:hypothetical protein